MTLQDVFDKVWNHYIVEKGPAGARPSATNSGSTRWIPYYGGAKAERKDPVTLFDKDSVLTGMYGTVLYIADNSPEKLEQVIGGFPKDGLALLAELQSAHDLVIIHHGVGKEFHPCLEDAFLQVARHFKLTVPKGVVEDAG